MQKGSKPVTDKYLSQKLKESFKEFGDKLKEDLYQIKDEIMSELKKNRENDEAHQFSHMRINDDIQDLDKRVKTLEKHAPAS